MYKEILKWTADGIRIKWDYAKDKYRVWTKPTDWFYVNNISELTPQLFETLLEYKNNNKEK